MRELRLISVSSISYLIFALSAFSFAPAVSADDSPDIVNESETIENGDGFDSLGEVSGLKNVAVSCDGNRTCSGKPRDLISRTLVMSDSFRLVLGSGIVKSFIATLGCHDNWAVYIHGDHAAFDQLVNQVTVADVLDDTLWFVFEKDPAGDHCDIVFLYRGLKYQG